MLDLYVVEKVEVGGMGCNSKARGSVAVGFVVQHIGRRFYFAGEDTQPYCYYALNSKVGERMNSITVLQRAPGVHATRSCVTGRKWAASRHELRNVSTVIRRHLRPELQLLPSSLLDFRRIAALRRNLKHHNMTRWM